MLQTLKRQKQNGVSWHLNSNLSARVPTSQPLFDHWRSSGRSKPSEPLELSYPLWGAEERPHGGLFGEMRTFRAHRNPHQSALHNAAKTPGVGGFRGWASGFVSESWLTISWAAHYELNNLQDNTTNSNSYQLSNHLNPNILDSNKATNKTAYLPVSRTTWRKPIFF